MNVYVRELARAMAGCGATVDIFTREHDESGADGPQIADGVNVVHIRAGDPDAPLEHQHNYLDDFVAGMHEYRLGECADYLAVHSNYWLSGSAGVKFAADINRAHVVTFHTLAQIKMQSRSGEAEIPERRRAETEIIGAADCIIAYSAHERDAMVRLYGADARRIELIPCGVDLSRFRPLGRARANRKLGLKGNKILLYVGRIEALKGVDLLIHTAAQLESDETVQVLVVGSDADGGQEIARLQRMADDLNVGANVEFVGRVPQEQLAWYYSAADVCVVPSFYESFGLAALESMACGTPVVASRVGGLPTIVQHGRTGYLKSWRCPESFANSVEMIMDNRSLRDSMGRAARHRAEGLSWDRVAQRLLELYARLAVDRVGRTVAA